MNPWPDGKLTKTVDEVAKLLSVHRNIVLRWVKADKIACTRLGRNSIQFTWGQVEIRTRFRGRYAL
ncbi:MAG: excisionase family DNA-binding protein [candidate division Zixibacteria bacterium]|nr:excisionase family DNA-binding protein [candidate division Zixibacteria bacterium]